MGKQLSDVDFVGGAKITGLPVSIANGQPVVHEQLTGLSGGVTESTLAGDLNRIATVASAATCDIGAATSQRVNITGTTTITSFGSQPGRLRFVTFAGALTLTHNATSLKLPTGANIVTTAGDAAVFLSDASGNWTCLAYMRANGKALVESVGTGANSFTGQQTVDGPIYSTEQTVAGPIYCTGASAVVYINEQDDLAAYWGLYAGGDILNIYSTVAGAVLMRLKNDKTLQQILDASGTFRQIVHAGNVATYAAPPTSGTAILKGDGSGGFAAASAGTDYLSSGVITSGNLGYGSGTGGTVTQATSPSTAVTLNKRSGKITTQSLSLNDSSVEFTFNNSTIGADDILVVQGKVGAGCTVDVRGNTAGSRIINFSAVGAFSGAVTFSFVVLSVAST